MVAETWMMMETKINDTIYMEVTWSHNYGGKDPMNLEIYLCLREGRLWTWYIGIIFFVIINESELLTLIFSTLALNEISLALYLFRKLPFKISLQFFNVCDVLHNETKIVSQWAFSLYQWSQRHKNLGSRVALLPRKFLVRPKIFWTYNRKTW